MRTEPHVHRCGICRRYTRCDVDTCTAPYELPCLERCSVDDTEPLSVVPIAAVFLRRATPLPRRVKANN